MDLILEYSPPLVPNLPLTFEFEKERLETMALPSLTLPHCLQMWSPLISSMYSSVAPQMHFIFFFLVFN